MQDKLLLQEELGQQSLSQPSGNLWSQTLTGAKQ